MRKGYNFSTIALSARTGTFLRMSLVLLVPTSPFRRGLIKKRLLGKKDFSTKKEKKGLSESLSCLVI